MEANDLWQQYRRIQEILLEGSLSAPVLAALESKLNVLLEALASGASVVGKQDTQITDSINTELCRDRRHARLRARHIIAEPHADAEHQLNARIELSEIAGRLSPDDWLAVLMAAEGYSFEEIGAALEVSPGASRTRVSRTRSRLRAA